MGVPGFALILTFTTAVPVTLSAQGPAVSSERWPPVTVGVPEEFPLLGSTTIDLYGVATAEIHALDLAEAIRDRAVAGLDIRY